MNILNYSVNLKHHALEVYLAGCTRHCPGCHNPESWNFDAGQPYVAVMRSIKAYVKASVPSDFLKHIWILGGEPLDQPHADLKKLINYLASFLSRTCIWLFTGNSPSAQLVALAEDLGVDYIKYGYYAEALGPVYYPDFDLTLASSNQGIIHLPRREEKKEVKNARPSS